ncbi:hypothetical protein IPF37_00015 [bacterium]|nr:MAG: hypothetical protein IPF37_00015 [bacterium]
MYLVYDGDVPVINLSRLLFKTLPGFETRHLDGWQVDFSYGLMGLIPTRDGLMSVDIRRQELYASRSVLSMMRINAGSTFATSLSEFGFFALGR